MKKKVKIGIGAQRKLELYNAISDPITDLRIKHLKEGKGEKQDKVLYDLVDTIWRKQAEILGIENP